MKKAVIIDLETRSSVDLKVHGRKAYMESPDFEIILLAYKVNDGLTKVLEFPSLESMQDILDMADTVDINMVAHNAAFEMSSLKRVGCDIHDSIWRCTMLMSQYHGYPMSLESSSKALKLRVNKMNEGKQLIDLFTKPISAKVREKNKLPEDKKFWLPIDFPEKWETFKNYCKMDVEVAYMLYQTLPCVPTFVWEEWLLNYNINNRGILIDTDFCRIAINDIKDEEEDLMQKLKNITKLDNPRSRDQLKRWIYDNHGLTINSLTKEVMENLIKEDKLDNEVKEVLNLFKGLSKTSTAKYTKFLELGHKNKIYDILNFYGARTGRWSSWGVQLQNMRRIEMHNYKELRNLAKEEMLPMFYEDMSNIYSQLIRTSIVAPSGKKLIIADFSQIEARVLQWLANNQETLEIFKSGKDYYTYTASTMFNKPYEEISKDSKERRDGKTASLALGYGGAVGALSKFGGGKEMSEREQVAMVKLWRKANPNVVRLWSQVNDSFVRCFISKEEVVLPIAVGYELRFNYGLIGSKNYVSVTLPSGRTMFYPDIKSGAGGEYVFYGKSSEDQFLETYTKIYGGFLVENITQAIARDCLQMFITRIDQLGIKVIFHVHDEVICEVNENEVEELLGKILELSKTCCYKGLPVVAEPKASEYYDK